MFINFFAVLALFAGTKFPDSITVFLVANRVKDSLNEPSKIEKIMFVYAAQFVLLLLPQGKSVLHVVSINVFNAE